MYLENPPLLFGLLGNPFLISSDHKKGGKASLNKKLQKNKI